MKYIILFCTLFVALMAAPLHAKHIPGEDEMTTTPREETVRPESPEHDNSPHGQEFNYWREFSNMLVMLTFILAALVLFAWILKKLMGKRMLIVNTKSSIKIIERRALAPKVAVYLLDVMGHGIIVGESPAGLQRLGELPPGTDLSSPQDPQNDPSLFKQFMKKAEEKE